MAPYLFRPTAPGARSAAGGCRGRRGRAYPLYTFGDLPTSLSSGPVAMVAAGLALFRRPAFQRLLKSLRPGLPRINDPATTARAKKNRGMGELRRFSAKQIVERRSILHATRPERAFERVPGDCVLATSLAALSAAAPEHPAILGRDDRGLARKTHHQFMGSDPSRMAAGPRIVGSPIEDRPYRAAGAV
jgi:hypothetical protein